MAGFFSATILLATAARSGYLFTAAKALDRLPGQAFLFQHVQVPVLGLIPNSPLRRAGEVRSPIEVDP